MKHDRPRILFVCGRNQWRSPTATQIYARDTRIEVRSAGMSPKSGHPLSSQDIIWADLILVMEDKYRQRIRETFRDNDTPQIESLDIPDEYAYMDPELVSLIHDGTEPLLAAHFGLA